MDADRGKLDAFMGRMIGHMTGAAVCYSIWLGDELGFYRELAGSEPRTADSLAETTGCHARLVREWLDGQAAGGLVAYDAGADTYQLGPEAAMALSDDTSPVFVARAMHTLGSMYLDVQKTAQAFRGDGAMSWGEHHPCLFSGTEWFFRTGYRAHLTASWILAFRRRRGQARGGRPRRGCRMRPAVPSLARRRAALAYPDLGLLRHRLSCCLRSRLVVSGAARGGAWAIAPMSKSRVRPATPGSST